MSGGRDWTKREVDFLRENFARMGAAALAPLLKRTLYAVKSKAKVLGLSACDAETRRERQSEGWIRRGQVQVPAGVSRDPRVASIMHLVDLKRAGYSPRRTELRIPGEAR